jgi:hypothetical protein
VLSGGPKRLHFLGHRIVFGERIRHRLEHGPQLLSIFPLSLEESGPGLVRIVPIEELVSLVGNTFGSPGRRVMAGRMAKSEFVSSANQSPPVSASRMHWSRAATRRNA